MNAVVKEASEKSAHGRLVRDRKEKGADECSARL